MWQTAGIQPEPGSRLRILDIACGCAIKSLVLAEKSPAVQVTCLDSAEVLAVARDLAQRMQILSQVTFQPENLLTADLGKARYDTCLLGQITHYLTEQQNRDLFQRIHAALLPDGILVIDCPMATEQPSESTSFLTLVLWANGGGASHSFEAYRAWLQDAGFGQVRQMSERWLCTTRQSTRELTRAG
jgi:cyclopropane fatty-acyl-phospholipid synthase-like methyltransferase